MLRCGYWRMFWDGFERTQTNAHRWMASLGMISSMHGITTTIYSSQSPSIHSLSLSSKNEFSESAVSQSLSIIHLEDSRLVVFQIHP